MRNLLFFIYKYHVFFIFFLLELVAFIIIFRFNNYQKASFLNYTSAVAGNIYNGVSNTQEYFNLRRVNDSLQIENARLRTYQITSYYNNNISINDINDTVYKQQYQYIAAQVVNNSVNKRNNYLTLNRGRLHGIEKEMGVISENGVVGIVMNVSEHYCTVLSLLNSNAKISAKFQKTGAFGSLVWDGIDPKFAKLLDVNKHVPIKIGDVIITSNFSTIFPEGLPIGRVYNHSLEAGDNFHSISIELFTDFSTVHSVYIIKNLFKQEQQELEQLIPVDKK
ncbi:MAG: rod shape-determining protein MreC [Bacteroidia bacterium]|nr:rod shape-determining protein MreC [Bacteroidia bacterium]MCZ2139816.1 rod shape-determining protein MreC [Bacteroidia bacterium]